MNKIYKIEFNDFVYYGSTKQKLLSSRQAKHNYNLKHNPKQLLYSKAKDLGIDKLICKLICECNDLDRIEIENNLINSSKKECLNSRRVPYTEEERKIKKIESNKKYYQSEKGKQKRKEADKRYYQRNKLLVKIQSKGSIITD